MFWHNYIFISFFRSLFENIREYLIENIRFLSKKTFMSTI